MIFANTTGYSAGKKFETKGTHRETEAQRYYSTLGESYYLPEYKYTTKSELILALSGERTLLKKGCPQLAAADKLVGLTCGENALLEDQPISACFSPELMFERAQLFLFISDKKPMMYARIGFYPRLRDTVAHLLVSDSKNISAWNFGGLPESEKVANLYFKKVLLLKENAYQHLCLLGFNSEYSSEDNCYLSCLKLSICNRKLYLRSKEKDSKDHYQNRIEANKKIIELRIKNIAKKCYSTYFTVTGDTKPYSDYFTLFRISALTLFCYDYLWPYYTPEELKSDFNAEVGLVFVDFKVAFDLYTNFRSLAYAQMYVSSDQRSIQKRAKDILKNAKVPDKIKLKTLASRHPSPDSSRSQTDNSITNSVVERFQNLSMGLAKKDTTAAAKELIAKKLADKLKAAEDPKSKETRLRRKQKQPLDESVRALNDTILGMDIEKDRSEGEENSENMLKSLGTFN
jgi:hypothetical protein